MTYPAYPFVVGPGYLERSTITLTPPTRLPEPRCRLDEIVWISPDGTWWHWPMNQPAGIEGRGLPPVIIDEQDVLGDGASQGTPRFGVREIHIPFHYASTQTLVRRKIRAWAAALAADRRLGTILVRTMLNDERQISCRYASGFEMVEANNRWVTAGITFRCPEPFWEDATPIIETWSPTTETKKFFPIPNPTTGSFITLSQGNLITEVTVNNSGDMEAWPVWRITGPGSGQVKLEHVESGQIIEFSRSLGPGETITIDTRPGVKTVMADDGSNEFRSLSSSQLFSLPPGDNTLRFSIGGAETDTTVELSYRRQWLTA